MLSQALSAVEARLEVKDRELTAALDRVKMVADLDAQACV
jgi:hypothetical protein